MRSLFALSLLALPAFAAFPNGYSFCKVVTTHSAMVSGSSDLTNYPLALILTDTDLKSPANGGFVNSINGYDIGFYPDCSGFGAALKWELESYSPQTGAIVAHVLRPNFSRTADDTIGMYYGGGFTSFQSMASAVWVGYAGVWHLADGTTLGLTDSTANANNGLNSGATATPGQLDGAANFTRAANQYITVPDSASLQITGGNLTLEAWVKVASNSGTGTSRILSKLGNSPYTGYELYTDQADSKNDVTLQFGNGGATNYLFTSSQISLNVWTHIVATLSSGTMAVYFNGVLQPVAVSSGQGSTVLLSGTTNLNIGRWPGGNTEWFPGKIDEVRISPNARSRDWVLTEYRNQSAPGTYLSAGPRIGGSSIRHRVSDGD